MGRRRHGRHGLVRVEQQRGHYYDRTGLHVTTTGARSGIYQIFPATALTAAGLWVDVIGGAVFVDVLGPGGSVFTPTSGSGVIWLPVNGVVLNEIVIYSASSDPADFFVDAAVFR